MGLFAYSTSMLAWNKEVQPGLQELWKVQELSGYQQLEVHELSGYQQLEVQELSGYQQ